MASRTGLEALEEKLMAAEKPRSFASFASDIQERFQRVDDYADMFVERESHTIADSLWCHDMIWGWYVPTRL